MKIPSQTPIQAAAAFRGANAPKDTQNDAPTPAPLDDVNISSGNDEPKDPKQLGKFTKFAVKAASAAAVGGVAMGAIYGISQLGGLVGPGAVLAGGVFIALADDRADANIGLAIMAGGLAASGFADGTQLANLAMGASGASAGIAGWKVAADAIKNYEQGK